MEKFCTWCITMDGMSGKQGVPVAEVVLSGSERYISWLTELKQCVSVLMFRTHFDFSFSQTLTLSSSYVNTSVKDRLAPMCAGTLGDITQLHTAFTHSLTHSGGQPGGSSLTRHWLNPNRLRAPTLREVKTQDPVGTCCKQHGQATRSALCFIWKSRLWQT